MISYIIFAFVFSLQCEGILTILNGELLTHRDAQFMVAVIAIVPPPRYNHFKCVGVEVHRRYILTTKVCTIPDVENETLAIRYGSVARYRGNYAGVVEIITNEDFTVSYARIALLQLNEDIPLPGTRYGAVPITLPPTDFVPEAGMPITVIGYGVIGQTPHYRRSRVTTSIYAIIEDGNLIVGFNSLQDGFQLINYTHDEGALVFYGNIFVGVVTQLDTTGAFMIITNISRNKVFIESIINRIIEK